MVGLDQPVRASPSGFSGSHTLGVLFSNLAREADQLSII